MEEHCFGTDRLVQAFGLTVQLHSRQRRKTRPVPYLSHLLAVAALVIEAGGDEDDLIAALLHDAVEDQGGAPTLETIRNQFGARVAEIVTGCTETDLFPKPPWRERKETYLRHMEEASPPVLRIALADKLHNARDLLGSVKTEGTGVLTRFNSEPKEQIWFFSSLVEVFRRRSPGRQAEELAETVEALRALIQ